MLKYVVIPIKREANLKERSAMKYVIVCGSNKGARERKKGERQEGQDSFCCCLWFWDMWWRITKKINARVQEKGIQRMATKKKKRWRLIETFVTHGHTKKKILLFFCVCWVWLGRVPLQYNCTTWANDSERTSKDSKRKWVDFVTPHHLFKKIESCRIEMTCEEGHAKRG